MFQAVFLFQDFSTTGKMRDILAYMGMGIIMLLPIFAAIAIWKVPDPMPAVEKKIPLGEGLRFAAQNPLLVRILLIIFLVIFLINLNFFKIFFFNYFFFHTNLEWILFFLKLYFFFVVLFCPVGFCNFYSKFYNFPHTTRWIGNYILKLKHIF